MNLGCLATPATINKKLATSFFTFFKYYYSLFFPLFSLSHSDPKPKPMHATLSSLPSLSPAPKYPWRGPLFHSPSKPVKKKNRNSTKTKQQEKKRSRKRKYRSNPLFALHAHQQFFSSISGEIACLQAQPRRQE
jgi:hypothetical protein